MIDEMTDEERKEMLKEVSRRQPAIILDVAAILSKRQHERGSDPEPDPVEASPSWCTCGKCPEMSRDEDKVCCNMAPQFCNSLRPVSSFFFNILSNTLFSIFFLIEVYCLYYTNKD